MLEQREWPLTDAEAARLIDVLAAAGDRRAALEIFHAFDRRIASPEAKQLVLAAYERALWSPSGAESKTLPAAQAPLVGRDAELRGAVAALSERPALQIIGPGGIGKSRLALEVARVYASSNACSAHWIRVTDAMDAGELATATARALRLPENGGFREICALLREDQPLVVFDSCENSLQTVETFCASLIEQSPSARLLFTSRRALGMLSPQTALELGPLNAADASPAQPAARLFAERAMSANPHFAVTAENAQAIVSICTLLHGVPLAIELACGYLAHVGIHELAARIQEGASGDISQIVEQTLAWRLQLLPESDRALFVQLSIFASDFSAGDAGALTGQTCGPGLERLAAAFLIVREPSESFVRFRLLDPVRSFARAQIGEDDAFTLRARFVAYAAGLTALTTTQMNEMSSTLLNALRLCCTHRLIESGLTILANAGIALGLAGFAKPTLQYADELVGGAGENRLDANDGAIEAWSWLFSRCGQPAKSVEINASRIERARRSGDPMRLRTALATSVIAARNVGDFERAYAYAQEAALLARSAGDTRNLAKALRGLASLHNIHSKFEQAVECFEELFALDEQALGATEYTMLLHDYAITLRELGRPAEAAPLLRRCIERAMAAREYASAIHAQTTLARLSQDAGRIEQAHALLSQTLPLCRHDVNPLTRMYAFEDFTGTCLRDGQYEAVAFVLGYVDRTRERIHYRPGAPHLAYIRKIRSAVQSRLGVVAYADAYNRGKSASLDEVFARLESLEPGTTTIDNADRFAPLSAREREVAELAAQGRTNREIAQAFTVSVRTVDAHMATILRKLGIERREQLLKD